MCTNVFLSRLFGLSWQLDDLKWGKYLDLFNLKSAIAVSEAQGWKRLSDYCWCMGAASLPLPHHRAVYGISLAHSRDWLSSRTLHLYKNTSLFSPKRQVWMRQIWHFELQEEGEGAVHAAAVTPHHHTARWTQTLRPGHKYSQVHYVQECGWDMYRKKLQVDD